MTKDRDIETGAGVPAQTGTSPGGTPGDAGSSVTPGAVGAAKPAAAGKRSATGASPATRPAGRGLAAIAFLCGLAALAGVGYLYWLLVLGAVPVEQRVAALEGRFALVDERSQGAAGAPDTGAIRRETDRLAAELRQEFESQLRAAVDRGAVEREGAAAAQVVPRDWQLAEARYLLRMANHRLLLERDAAGAAVLLRGADDVLAAIDDFALHEVRVRIAEETLALESLPVLDAEGLFLQIEAIKRDLGRLPLRLPELQPADVRPVEPTGIWAVLRAELAELVRFRHFDGAVRPLLAPEEAVYLELNLRLMLERAQLAGLRREQAIYEQSIATASDWIERYLDLEAPDVRRLRDGLRALEGVSLAAPLPDISGSLNALNAVARPGS